jgi:rod shape determining protein RodA|tara:strand:- start:3103 stop:4404 length:1302 start_codon:yes stop_codon:yes gene_type:complete
MRSKRNIFQNIDWFTIVLYGILVLIGWLNIYAANYNEDEVWFSFSKNYGKQLIWIVASLALIWMILMLEARLFSTFAYSIYALGIAMLIGVLIFGMEIKGAKSWFVFGGISFQPSEFAKFGTALAITKYLTNLKKNAGQFKVRFQAIFILLLPAALIMLQPDTGSVLVYAAFVFVLYREGLSGKILLFGLGLALFFILALLLKQTSIDVPFGLVMQGKLILIATVITICGFIYWFFNSRKRKLLVPLTIAVVMISSYVLSVDYVFDNVMSPHQQDRINELLGITFDPSGAGYNVNQSKIAIGSGGFFGKGFLQGTQTKYNFVPEQSTDFIFCTVGEEWGFIGSFVVIVAFVTLFIRLIFLAERQRSSFTRIYFYTVVSILFFHFAINIGMTIGLAPVIGIPLPFFSYGGSSLWSFTVLLFVALRLDGERMHIL